MVPNGLKRSALVAFSILLLSSYIKTEDDKTNQKVPFVYHPRYNIWVFGLEKWHPFDTHKYAHIVEGLKKHFHWADEQFHKPRIATDEELKEFHSSKYIDSLNQSWTELLIRAACFGLMIVVFSQFVTLRNHWIKLTIAGIYALWGLLPFQAKAYSQGIYDDDSLTIHFMAIPGPILRHCLLAPMKYAVNGTALALEKALEPNGPGWCVNLSGGYHHARSVGGGGFCFFNDTVLALKKRIEADPNFKALIIDLDFHCGDGNADFIMQPKDMLNEYKNYVTIIDIYGGIYYPFVGDLNTRSIQLEKNIQYPNPIAFSHAFPEGRPMGILKGEKDSRWYLDLLHKNLNKVSNEHFNCIIFNAGTDVYEGDALGGKMGLTAKQIIERDATVFRFARERKIPIVQVLSGGYDKQMGAKIVTDCLINTYNIMCEK